MTERRSFTAEFKREAVRLAKERGNVAATARDLGISSTSLENWIRLITEHSDKAFPGHGNPRDKDFVSLQRENRLLKEENEILKKAVGIFTVRPQ